MGTIISVLFGGLITGIFAHLYYVKAGKELKKETKELRSLTEFIGKKLHDSGVIELPTDDNGRSTYEQTTKSTGIKSSESFGTPTIKSGDATE